MLLPTIKLIPELELALIQSFNRNRWWYHTTSIDTSVDISYEADEPTNYLIERIAGANSVGDDRIPRNEMKGNENKAHDFVTNLCLDNIRKYYACWLWIYLSCNPSAIEVLLMFQTKIRYSMLATNTHPDAVGLIEKKDKMMYDIYCELCSNPSAVHLIQKNHKPFSIYYLSLNPNPAIVDIVLQSEDSKRNNIWDTCFLQNRNSIEAFLRYLGIDAQLLHSSNQSQVQYLKDAIHGKKFSWQYLSVNPHTSAVKILDLFPDRIHCDIVMNSGEDAYSLICKYVKQHAGSDIRVMRNICKNTNPRVLELLDDYPPDLYDWGALCKNPSAIPILTREENRNRIKALYLLQNPNIFVYNYENMRRNTQVFKEELIERVWSPSNVAKWLRGGYDEFLDYKEWGV
jgi:hypothetical protein